MKTGKITILALLVTLLFVGAACQTTIEKQGVTLVPDTQSATSTQNTASSPIKQTVDESTNQNMQSDSFDKELADLDSTTEDTSLESDLDGI